MINTLVRGASYGPFLVKLPNCLQKLKLLLEMFFLHYYISFYLITNKYTYLHQDHFVTKLNHCLLVSGRAFYPPKNVLPLPWKTVTANLKYTKNGYLVKVPLQNSHNLLNYMCTLRKYWLTRLADIGTITIVLLCRCISFFIMANLYRYPLRWVVKHVV